MSLHFLRHLETCASAAGLCYGVSDVPARTAPSAELVDQVLALEPQVVVSSDLQRCRLLAEQVAPPRAPVQIDARWRERDFGEWEGRSWDDIYRETPSDIEKLMSADFAPTGGESLASVRKRVAAALADLPKVHPILIISHGGPIALARLALAGLPLEAAAQYIPATGEIVTRPIAAHDLQGRVGQL